MTWQRFTELGRRPDYNRLHARDLPLDENLEQNAGAARLLFEVMRRTTAIDTARLIDRALRGDRSALETLVRAETPRLYGIAWRIVGDASLAEDVVQEVFMRILQRRSPLRRKGAARAWLTRVTAHAAIDLVRRNAARERREEWHVMPGAEQRSDACGKAAAREIHSLVAEGFAALPVEVRGAVWLTVVEGDSLRRTADAVGLSVTTTHRRVHEGLETLRAFLVRRGGTAFIALPMVSLLGSIPAPPPPGGLALRVLARCSIGPGVVGRSSAPSTLFEKGALRMAAMSAKHKIAVNVCIGLLLLLGGAGIIADPFGFRSERDQESPTEPAALDAPTTESDDSARRSATTSPPNEERAVSSWGSVLARAVYEDDRSPASGVLARGFGKGEGKPRTLSTDADGVARFERIPAGEFRVYLQLGSQTFSAVSVDVQAGAESEATLELPPGVQIDGVVVDRDGAPVAGASVWLTEPYNAFQGRSIATSDEDGTFRLKHVDLKRLIGARAPGFAPSLLRTVEGRPTSTLPVRIALDQPGVVVQGVVVGPQGIPLPDAIVQIVKTASGRMRTRDRVEIRYAPLSTRTDRDGGFAFDCVPVGKLTIAARWEDLVPFEEPIEVPDEGLSDVTIALEEGAIVTGTVLTPQGEFARGTLVAIGPGESTEPYRTGNLSSVATGVRQDGTYRLVGVRPGEFEVRADSRGKGKASARLTARAGEGVHWDAQLTLGNEILGRVVDERGIPLEKVLVGAKGEDCVHIRIRTDTEGRFRFSNCKEVPHDVEAHRDDQVLRAVHERATPGRGEVTLVVRRGSEPSAFISGRVVDPEGKPAGTASVIMSGLSRIYTEEDGAFRIGPLRAGRHSFDVLLGECPRVRRVCELRPNETVDVGTIRVHRGGRVEARLRRADGTPFRGRVRILDHSAVLDVRSTRSPDGVVSSEVAQPGDYFIVVWKPRGVATSCTSVRIEEGRTTAVEVTVQDGVEREFRLRAADKPQEPARLIVETEGGIKVFDCPLQPDSGWSTSPEGAGFTRGVQVSFAPGTSYTAVLLIGDGRATATFFVAELAATPEPILLDVR